MLSKHKGKDNGKYEKDYPLIYKQIFYAILTVLKEFPQSSKWQNAINGLFLLFLII